MSSFFGRMSARKASSADQRPQLVKSQSTDSNRYSGSHMARSSFEESSATASALRTSSSSSALAHKFQGESTASSTTTKSPVSTPSSKSSRGSGRERRKPIVVHYEQSPALESRQVGVDTMALEDPIRVTVKTTATNRRLSRAHTADSYDDDMDTHERPFDVESAMAGFMASFSPSRSRNRHHHNKYSSSSGGNRSPVPTTRPSSTSSASEFRRSQTLQRLSVNLTSSQRHAQRAEVKAKKYDVEWRGDHESTCCQVCYAMFTKLSRRRHHCRVCGDLVCGDCSADQVLLQGRFESPKRACVACVTLLQVMMHNGDPRVSIDGNKSVSHGDQQQQPLATPRYHDRLGEVHRVMAAGKKSERRGSTQSEMYVISSKWLRSWLSFTRSTDGQTDDGFAPTSSSSSTQRANAYSPSNAASPPGPIDNLPLLELSKGKLVKRPELVRDDNVENTEEGDYQLISTEVWEVLQRLYGGGPAIRVVSDDNFRDWIVDVYALLSNAAPSVPIRPTVENVLVNRHEVAIVTRASFISREKAALISSGGYESVNILAQSSRSSTVGSGGRMSMSGSSNTLKDLAEKGTSSTDRGSFSSRASLNQARIRPNSPKSSNSKNSSQLHYESGSRLRSSISHQGTVSDVQSTSENEPQKAATAASAFAVAMKQARLNAQKAIDDRSRNQNPS